MTIQNPAIYSGSSLGGSYPPLKQILPPPQARVAGGRGDDLFILDQTGSADHVFWDSGNVGLDQLQQSVVSCPCAVSWGNGRVDSFAVLNDLDYSLVHFWLDSGQLQQSESLGRPLGNWNAIPIPLDGSEDSAIRLALSEGLYFASPPCVCAWGPGRIDVFAFANKWDPQSGTPTTTVDARIVQLTFEGNWLPWNAVPLPGGITVVEGSGPIATSWGAGRIDLMFLDNRGYLRHAAFMSSTFGGSNSWSLWESLSPPAAGFGAAQPCAVSWGAGRLDVFVVGLDNNLYHQWYDAAAVGGPSWAAAWENVGSPSPNGGIQGSITACSWAQGRLDILARGNDVDAAGNQVPALWHLSFDGSWNNWESLGGVIQSDPTVVSWGPNRIDVFAAGGNINSLGSQNWIPWQITLQG